MTRSLLLMRHAKSDWNDANLTDKDRFLNARGQAAAPLMAEWLVTSKLLPDLVLCSSAVRTKQTLELMMECWRAQHQAKGGFSLPEVIVEDRLYLATEDTILAVASGQSNLVSIQRILILGHNPGMEVLASRLSEQYTEMPTAAIVVLESNGLDQVWPGDWHDVKMWKRRGMVKPKDLHD